jgi:endonuclease/exonuclease/phosphatase family metal-dependent hydrolase
VQRDAGSRAVKFVTWNLLHRVHAENHAEAAIAGWPLEAQRVEAIASFLHETLTSGACDAALLQEVSGDVLAALRGRLPETFAVVGHELGRVSSARAPGSTRLVDGREFLVVIGPASTHGVASATFPGDPGKGYVAAQVRPGLVAVSTHVSWGPKREAQLQALRTLLAGGTVALGGDFNTGREEVARALGAEARFAELPRGAGRTRPGAGGGRDIDHLVCRGAGWSEAALLAPPRVVSDHVPLAAALLV